MTETPSARAPRILRRVAAAIAVVLLAGACASAPKPDADGVLLLRGPATAVVNDCWFDGICTVTVQGVVVTTMAGFRSQPAPVWGASSGQPEVGSEVEVRCRSTGARSCTLLGSTAHYLRAVE